MPACPEAHKAEGLRLVLRPGGRKALGLVLPRPREHVVQAVRKGWGGGCYVALRTAQRLCVSLRDRRSE